MPWVMVRDLRHPMFDICDRFLDLRTHTDLVTGNQVGDSVIERGILRIGVLQVHVKVHLVDEVHVLREFDIDEVVSSREEIGLGCASWLKLVNHVSHVTVADCMICIGELKKTFQNRDN